MKKLTAFTLLVAILLLSCKKEKVSVMNQTNPSPTEDPLIAKARNYFEANVLQAGPAAVGTLDPRQRLKKSPVWEKAYISVTAKQDAVAVPLKFEKPMKFKAGGIELQLNRQSKLLIYEGSAGSMKAEVVTYIPDQANTQDKFSGIIIVEDWAGNRVNRYLYKNGQAFRLVENRNLINASIDCIKIDWYLCDIDESGNTSNCVYQYSEYIGACNQGLEPPGDSGGYEEYIEIEKRRYLGWEVYYESTQPYSWWVTGFDVLKGRGGVFTSDPLPRGSAITFMAPYNWREDSHVGDHSGSVANSDISGTLLIPNSGGVSAGTLEKTKIWYYSDVF